MFGKFSFLIKTTLVAVALHVALAARADAYSDYIDRYAPFAVEQMKQHGIPASITLAQGLLESGAGKSTLATEGNNHFGIKCHSDWNGKSMLRNDDRPNECFRVYESALDSFKDHSLFLKKKRYQKLFDLEATDYAGWARGLKSAGYATDPNYADRLITIIEKYALYSYDNNSSKAGHDVAEYIISTLADTHPIRRSRGLHYVIAAPGDTYSKIAKEFHLKKKDVLAYNDVAKDGEVRPWEEVYLQEKLTSAPEGVKTATVGQDENIHAVAQRYGMKMGRILELNPGVKDTPGVMLKLE